MRDDVARWRSVSRLRARDVMYEATLRTARRPGRALLAGFGTFAGIGMLVATLGIAETASHQVSARFDALRSTELRIEPTSQDDVEAFPSDARSRLRRLNGVVHVGRWWLLSERAGVAKLALDDDVISSTLVAASSDALAAAGAHLAAGRGFDRYVTRSGGAVALIGRDLARRLEIGSLTDQPAIFVDGVALTVIGIVDRAPRRPELLTAVILAASTARDSFRSAFVDARQEVLVESAPGAAQLLARQAPLALRPDRPSSIRALAPPDPDALRQTVERDIYVVVLLLGLVALIVGVATIANGALTSVLSRTPELGIRRAVGARPVHLGVHVVAEALVLGGACGLVGACAGVIVVAGVALQQGWVAVLDLRVPILAPLCGATTAGVAALYAATRASRMDPIEALRR